MLANLLAIVVGLGSLAFYLSAFILPEVHRRSDFFWSGVGMFYAVVLWFCARQMSGAVLLGQTASVGLLLWFGYQTLRLRRVTTPAGQQTPIQFGSQSERGRTAASRPIIKDYEFVEDGVDDVVDQEPDPDSPILIKPAADEFALKMVVPAAIPNGKDVPEEKPAAAKDSAVKDSAAQANRRPNPLEAVSIFADWLKEVITPQKKAPKPMIELPPRPPSIPKSADPEPATPADTLTPSADSHPAESPSEANSEATDTASAALTEKPPANSEPAAVIAPDAAQVDDDEDSNWPEDDFWE